MDAKGPLAAAGIVEECINRLCIGGIREGDSDEGIRIIRCAGCCSRRVLGTSYRDEIGVVEGANVALSQRYDGLRLPGRADELDLDAVGLIDLDDGAEVAFAESVFRNVAIEYDRI